MSSVIRQEVIVFFSAVCHGILLTFGYDILRALRRAFVHNLAAISAEDFLFWLIAGFATFCLLFGRTDGVLRGYVAVGIMLGALLYHSTVSRPFVKLFAALLGYMRKGCQFLCRCLIFPAAKTAAVGKKLIELASKRGYNLVVKLKKRWKLIRRKNENFAHKDKRGRRYGKKKKASKQK